MKNQDCMEEIKYSAADKFEKDKENKSVLLQKFLASVTSHYEISDDEIQSEVNVVRYD